MKKYILLAIVILSFGEIQSQEISDAVRFSNNDLSGTARFTAMSGAFGALGGDLSAINVNPAGSAIFMRSQIGFTLSNYNINNKTSYYGSTAESCTNTFDINQFGAVFVFNNSYNSDKWKKFTIGVNYQNTNNFDNALFSAGVNPTTSVANYFLSYANGVPVDILQNSVYPELNYQTQQAFLGYQAYIINPATNNPNNEMYVSNVPSGGNYYQENYYESSGYNGKLAFNMSTSFKDRLYLGLNLNSHFTNYVQYTSFYESNANSQTTGVRNLFFENELYTYGYGFSFQLGAIAKLTDNLRFGFSYESPTWYEINDELRQTLGSRGYGYGNPPNNNLTSITAPSDFIMIYAPYNFHSPSVWTGSLAYVYQKVGLISIDYTFRDYSNTKFTPSNYYNSKNQAISNTLDFAGELRIGGEYRIKQLSLRGGYRFEQSPYVNKQTMGDLNGFSTGFGYNFGSIKFDFSYAYSHQNATQESFSQGFTQGAYVKTQNNSFSGTLIFEL